MALLSAEPPEPLDVDDVVQVILLVELDEDLIVELDPPPTFVATRTFFALGAASTMTGTFGATVTGC